MLKINLYWYCQILGWGAAGLYWSYYTVFNQPSVRSVLVPLVSVSVCIALTHQYKRFAHRHGWLRLSLSALGSRLPIALLALSLAYSLFNSGINYLGHYQDTFFQNFVGISAGGLRYNAIWLLIFHLYHYAKRESEIEMEKTRFENMAIRSQMMKLNAELNPHFLFNALNSIKALVLIDPEKARQSLVQLSGLLRYSITVPNKSEIPLREELEQIEDYIALEKIRLEDRLEVRIDIQPEALEALLPPLALHNLVENAIKHGISRQPEGGLLTVDCRILHSHLTLTVENTGRLTEGPDTGLGNANLQQRLYLKYNGNASFSIRQSEPDKVRATVQIPFHHV